MVEFENASSFSDKINKIFKNYGGYISVVLYIGLAALITNKDPYGLVSKYKALSILITLILGFFVVTLSNFVWKKDEFFGPFMNANASSNASANASASTSSKAPTLFNWLIKAGSSLGVVLLSGLIVYSIFLIISNYGRFLSFFYNLAFYISIIAGFGLLYKVLSPYFAGTKLNSFLELIKNIVFYLPCVLIDVIDNIAGTKRSIWILLAVEICAILAYFGLPYLMNSGYLKKGTILSSEPQHLNGISNLDKDALNDIVEISRNKMQYALSADIWIDPQPTSTSVAYTKDTNILSFGDRLRVEYNGQKPNKLLIKAMEGRNTIIADEPTIPLQKWNKLVLNYDHGTLDIFLNGELVHSQQNVPYTTLASIEAGSKNGIYGGIRDIRFFEKPLSKNEMYII